MNLQKRMISMELHFFPKSPPIFFRSHPFNLDKGGYSEQFNRPPSNNLSVLLPLHCPRMTPGGPVTRANPFPSGFESERNLSSSSSDYFGRCEDFLLDATHNDNRQPGNNRNYLLCPFGGSFAIGLLKLKNDHNGHRSMRLRGDFAMKKKWNECTTIKFTFKPWKCWATSLLSLSLSLNYLPQQLKTAQFDPG